MTEVSENRTFQVLPDAHCPKNPSRMPRCNGPSGFLRIFQSLYPKKSNWGDSSFTMHHAIFPPILAFSFCAAFCHAQAATDDVTFLKQAHAKYDAPFERNLQSFNCAVEFNWKQHFTEAVRVGDEGTDEEIAKLIQPIHNRVTVTRQNAAVSAGMTDDEVNKLPHGGMAEGPRTRCAVQLE